MKSYNLSEDKIKICLTDDEVESLFGSFDMIDYDSPHSRAILDSLICSALPEKMLPLSCEKVLIEVAPEEDGCSIQVTRIYDKGKRRQKSIKRHEYILLFKSSEDMIDYIKSLKSTDILNITDSKLFKCKNTFALYICFLGQSGFIKSASEYAVLLNAKSSKGAFIAEHGQMLYDSAIEKIYKYFG